MSQLLCLKLGCLLLLYACADPEPQFSSAERERLMARQWQMLKPIDPTNAMVGNSVAETFGEALFFETGLSANGLIACATCHDPTLGFGDGLSLSEGIGTTKRHSPQLFNVGFQRWFYWDGRRDTLWGQALAPLENDSEMGSDRLSVLRFISNHDAYASFYEVLFGSLPDIIQSSAFLAAKPMTHDPEDPRNIAWESFTEIEKEQINKAFSNLGKALAAFEMTLVTSPTPFDNFVQGLKERNPLKINSITPAAKRGLKLFMNDANCHLCHTGPLFSDREFHNLSFDPTDIGRTQGIPLAKASQFSSAGPFSDAPNGEKSVFLGAVWAGHPTDGAFKTPSLRNVSLSPPYMHDGRFATLKEVVKFYNQMPPETAIGDREFFLVPLELTEKDEDDIVEFLKSLTDRPASEL